MSEADGSVTVTFTDDGPGLARRDRERVFTPFYRGSAVPTITGGEVGLGLTIARGLARAHGGDVRLLEGGARGACFQVNLPSAPAPAAPSTPSGAATGEEPRR
jgi:two-component system, OmpR family, sensor kinase